MASMHEYFSKVAYKPTYFLGDRVRGLWCGVPFAGQVQVDTLLDEEAGPYLVVNLDLPINIDGTWYNMIKVKHSDLINIKGSYGINRKTNSKESTVGSN